MQQDIIEVDGWGQANKHVVTALGGFFGQMMIVLNTIAHYYPQLDRPARSGRSTTRKKTPVRDSGGAPSESGKSHRSGEKSEGEKSAAPRLILNPSMIQNFIYVYINEKLKQEKLNMQVDAKFEKFLKNLPSPLELNEIRTLKPEKYAQMRKILTNFTGSPVLKLIKDNQEELDLDPDVFDLVYEGFWDLYTLQPKVKDVSNKKLQ